MSDAERLSMWIAICKTCLLAEVMKDCAHCRFNVGLLERKEDKPVATGERNEKPVESVLHRKCCSLRCSD